MANSHRRISAKDGGVMIFIDPEAKKLLSELAKKDHRTLSGYVTHLVLKNLEEEANYV